MSHSTYDTHDDPATIVTFREDDVRVVVMTPVIR